MFTTKRGRPRTQGVARFPSGQIKPEAITATAEEARIRQLLGVDVWKDTKRKGEKALQEARKRVSNPLLGHALGRLLYGKEIDQGQHDGGMYFAWLWRAHAKVRGLPSPNIRAIDYGAITGGYSTYPEDSEEWVRDIRRRWENVQSAIYHANGDQGLTTGPVRAILVRVLVEDIGPQDKYELGHLRVGLNAINKSRGV